jgi:hypothetical protein
MPDPNARLTMRLSPVTSNREPGHYMSLVISDITSGQRVAQFDLLGDHLLDLLATRQVGGVDGMDAWLIEPDNRQNLGRMHGTTTRRFPTATFEEVEVMRWCATNCRAIGGTNWRISQNNAGMHVVTWDHYVETLDQVELDAVIRRRQDTMDVLPDPRPKA